MKSKKKHHYIRDIIEARNWPIMIGFCEKAWNGLSGFSMKDVEQEKMKRATTRKRKEKGETNNNNEEKKWRNGTNQQEIKYKKEMEKKHKTN